MNGCQDSVVPASTDFLASSQSAGQLGGSGVRMNSSLRRSGEEEFSSDANHPGCSKAGAISERTFALGRELMRPRLYLTVLVALVMVALLPSHAFAQATVTFAQLNGTVEDSNSHVVAKAAIALREVDTNRAYTATTNDGGYYLIPNLPPGRYELTVSYTGFAKSTHTGIVLSVGQTATVNVTLKVASIGEVVTVTTEAAAVEPTRTEISQVIDTQQIQNLPVSGRLFTDFALLTPGVATGRTSLGTTFTEFEITQISFGGMRSFSNIITVDGADFINSNTGVQRATPPQESVAEFRVVNNSFGSEYGRALGGIVNVVTKSGTNDLHGSIYDYLQNSATDSRSLLQPSSTPFALRQNQFGGTLGGPIVKNKTFFFLNYEGQRRGESPVLPPDFRDNFATINLAKSYIGLPLEPLDVLKTKDNDYGFARLDHQLTNSNRLTVRYNVEDARDLNQLVGNTEDGGGIGVPSGGRDLFIRDQSLVGTLNTLLKPELVNTVLAQYARRHYNFPGATGQPDLSVPNDLEFGHNFGTLDSIYESRVQFSDTLGWVKGNHYWKFGFDSNNIWDATIYPGFTPARIILPDLNCMMEFANFMNPAGTPLSVPGPPCPLPNGQAPEPPFLNFGGVGATFYGVALPRDPSFTSGAPLNNANPLDTTTWANAFDPALRDGYQFKLNHGYYGFFAQDQWRLTPKLTFNYGLRYDFETGLSDQIDSYWGAVQPRVGLAYSPDSKTVIRAGAGLFFDRNNMTFFFITGNQKTVPGFLPGITLPQVRNGADTGGWQLNLVSAPGALPPPVNCSVGPFLPPGLPCFSNAADAAQYILTTGLYPQVFLTGTCDPANNQFGCFVGAGGMDRHHSKLPYATQASLEIDREIAKGLTVDVGYLMVQAHRLVLGNGLNIPCPVGTSKPNNPSIAQGWLNPNGTTSSCSGTPELLVGKPFFTGPPNFNGQEFTNGGFLDYNYSTVNAIYHGLTLQAIERLGKYFTLNANYTYSHIIDNGNFTTFINLPQNQFDNISERGNSNQDVRHRFVTNFSASTPNHGFMLTRNLTFSSIITVQSGRPFTIFEGGDANGDTNPVTDRVGLIGRNTYIGDPLRSWDMRVSRVFQISERLKLDLSFDAFNLLNRQNVDEVFSVYGSPVFCGAVPAHIGDAASVAIQRNAASAVCPTEADLIASGQIPPEVAAGPPFRPPQFGVPPSPNLNFGTPRTMLNPRQLQFAIKFSF
jgi:outer membrane receptor protein involved in Fe transport